MFSDRIGWEDVERIPQNDSATAVATINYTEEFTHMMDLFRAVLQSREMSLRVLQLCKELLVFNAGNYTVWQYRRLCLQHLQTDLLTELDYLDEFADDNPKNYQLWYHRRVIVDRLQDPSRELLFCERVFEEDPKNYHAWVHRQWVITTFGLWENELQYVEFLLALDVRNNSAWNQRWFILHNEPKCKGLLQQLLMKNSSGQPVEILQLDHEDESESAALLKRELSFAIKCITKVSWNESAWNYIRGIWHMYGACCVQYILESCQLLEMSVAFGNNTFLLSLLADIREKEGSAVSLLQAKTGFQKLAQLDGVRVKYWTRREECVILTMSSTGADAHVTDNLPAPP